MTHDPLDRLGRLSAPEPDAQFADNLEARLRVMHAEQQPSGAPSPSSWRRILVVLPVAALLLVAATAVLVARDDAVSAALELTESVNVVVTLPDGTQLIDPVGLELTDGTVVMVGEDGLAVIDGVELSAGARVRVIDDQLVTDAAPPDRDGQGVIDVEPDADSVTDARGDSDSAPTTSVPGDSDRTTDRADRGDGGRDLPLDDQTDRPASTRPPEPDDPPADSPSGQEPGGDEAVLVNLGMRVHAGRDGIEVTWRGFGEGIEDVRVILLRLAGSGDVGIPDWPAEGAVVVLGETAGNDPATVVDALPDGANTSRYRVVAVLGTEVLFRSEIQTVSADHLAALGGDP